MIAGCDSEGRRGSRGMLKARNACNAIVAIVRSFVAHDSYNGCS